MTGGTCWDWGKELKEAAQEAACTALQFAPVLGLFAVVGWMISL
jgi:hypothetical protein